MRRILFGLAMLLAVAATAQQTFNNEWIDYAKTYYKFKVGSNGVYRITGATLAANGLGTADAAQFQLWRNGVQVPLYTSQASGALGSTDYIEFWGQMNDGIPDKQMYRDPSFQYNDKWSLLTDSATYFLTVNEGGNNLRLQSTTNNVSGNTLPAEPWFMYTAGKYYKSQVNSGLYYMVDADKMYSSSFDKGEGWASSDIGRNASLTENLTALYPAVSGPASTFRISVTGGAYNTRRYRVTINGDSIVGNLLPYMNGSVDEGTVTTSRLSTGTAAVVIKNITDDCGASTCPSDRMLVHKLELSYPRLFNFGGATNFEFTLPASNGTYLEITNFSSGGVAPVLYDLTNGRRYVAQIAGSLLKVVLEPSATPRNLVLVSQAAANIKSVTALQTRNFVDYNTAATQGDYLIISNPLLFDGANGSNPVEEYRAYRASAAGGSYNAKIYLEDQLIDQFGFGIKKNPAGIHNFIMYALNRYPVAPKLVFIIGRGVLYTQQRTYESSTNQTTKSNLEKLNLVPTFGNPASDMLLGADLHTSTPLIPVGRLTAITPDEVATYLQKVKEYETAQETLSPAVEDKAWMKNVAHVIGAGDDILDDLLFQYLESYRRKVEDTLYGARVSTFRKTSANAVEQLNDADLTRLMNEGLSLITYYGHSSATTLEFNLDEPANYNNAGKYPMFFALGCNAGNTFDYNEGRFAARSYLSDKYVMAPERGSINFIASTHFGIVHYLDIWNTRAYTNFSTTLYGHPLGEIMKQTVADIYSFTTTEDFFARCNAEETVLNGDPAVKLNQQVKPDYVLTENMVSVSPSFISVADQAFKVKINLLNLGKAVNKTIVVETKRQFPNQQIYVIRRDTISGIRYSDSLIFSVHIDPLKDKGSNKIIVTVDADNEVDELFETNNSASKDFVIFEEEARPIYPQQYAIVTQSNITLKASTANPFGDLKQYRMEIDTTQNFNSSLKPVTTISSKGGLLEFAPGITLKNGVVYYWRVAQLNPSGSYTWNTSSFIYLENSESGYNQSHYYQQTKSTFKDLELDSVSRQWYYDKVPHSLTARNTIYPSGGTSEALFTVTVDGAPYIRSACVGNSLIFNVFDANTFEPWKNVNSSGQNLYRFGSGSANCTPTRYWNFEFSYMTAQSRKTIMDFMDTIPNGSYVVVRSIDANNPNSFSSTWRADTALYGSNNSLYHKLKAAGFEQIDSLYTRRSWVLIYQKGNGDIQPRSMVSQGIYDGLTLSVDCHVPGSAGVILSPEFGPAKKWKQLIWDGMSVDSASGDEPSIDVIGVGYNGDTATLMTGITAQNFDVSSINTSQYPYLQLRMMNRDSAFHTPYQLKYWRLTYDPVPEGALAPNVYLKAVDTLDVGEPFDFQIAFKNVTASAFPDSVKVQMIVTDRNNVQHVLDVPRKKPLPANDTLRVGYTIDTKQLIGKNTLFINVNPEFAQPEQYLFNNFAYRDFYVRGDTLNPVLDVTFDNVHILNKDIVASKPDILIKLTDDAKWMLLNDTSIASVQIRFPSGSIKNYHYDNDTLTFIPATTAANAKNTASIRLKPYFSEDGEYEMTITGKDMSDNAAGAMSYKVNFQVINKPMISNMLNYPNPFTTSTAFVFTLTGSEVPQNIRIQILTVTGKVIKEITKQELGPLHIGRNITEYKWNGTDQYGQKLANGVYLYRVITNQKGKSLDKYRSDTDNTDGYFNKGYGKMYLMR